MARGEKQLLTINSWYTNFCISTQWASQYMPPCRVNERSFYSKAERRSYVALGIIIPSMIHFHHINRKHTEHKTTTKKIDKISFEKRCGNAPSSSSSSSSMYRSNFYAILFIYQMQYYGHKFSISSHWRSKECEYGFSISLFVLSVWA